MDEPFSTELVPEYNKVYERQGGSTSYHMLFLKPETIGDDEPEPLVLDDEKIYNAEILACFNGEDFRFIRGGHLARKFGLRPATPEASRNFLMGVRRGLSEAISA